MCQTSVFCITDHSLPCIYRIPKPLSAVTHGNPVSRKFCSCLLPTQWSKLPQMPIPFVNRYNSSGIKLRA